MIDVRDFVSEPLVSDTQSTQTAPLTPRLELDAENAAKGIGQLALAIVNLLHELLERQALRRMDNGTLTDEQIENLGNCLMKQSEAIDQLCEAFEISRDELNLDLGPLGTLV
jgi:hypothetical protein